VAIDSRSFSSALEQEHEVWPPPKTATKSTQKRANRTSANDTASKGFSPEEKAAARERVRELKAEAAKADGKTELVAAIARMQEPDRAIAKKIHALIAAAAPALTPKTWYGMSAYAKDGNVMCATDDGRLHMGSGLLA
jgi:hypothetical protein